MPVFHIATKEGPAPVEGLPYVAKINGRAVPLFIHTECPLEGPRVSCQRSGLKVGNIAPHLLARYVGTGHSDGPLDCPKVQRLGAALLMQSLLWRHDPDKFLSVLDAAPALKIMEGAA